MYRIYIVEDDEAIASLLQGSLQKWGVEAVCAGDFADILGEFSRVQPHLVLMDISLPFYNGYYWCGELRRMSRIPIIFISSHAENMDIVMAMNMGGDDYLTKPFSTDVLIAKVTALLRRVYSYTDEPSVTEIRGAIFNPADNSLSYGGRVIELTKNEQRILQKLISGKNRVITRSEMMQALWDSDSFVDDNTLTVNINRLRRKLEENGLTDFIQTKKGQGYMTHD